MSPSALPAVLPQGPWDLWAFQTEPQGPYRRVGTEHWVRLCQVITRRDAVVPVRVTLDPEGAYWGWLEAGQAHPTNLWPSRMAFRACFNGQPEEALAHRQSRGIMAAIVRVAITARPLPA